MKRYILVYLAVGLLLTLGSIALAGVDPGTGIKQTSHDLSSGGVGALYDAGTAADPTLDRICIYCHAPHHTIKDNLTYYPLWNHGVSVVTYATYTNGSDTPDGVQHQFNGQDSITATPGTVSRLCLSCHDGSVAVSTYGNGNSSTKHTGAASASGRIKIGGDANNDLSTHHPIGFNYVDVASDDNEINGTDTPLLGGNLYDMTIADLLWNGKMECSSCHDVHNTKNEGKKFTWVEDTQSNLCLTCHNK